MALAKAVLAVVFGNSDFMASVVEILPFGKIVADEGDVLAGGATQLEFRLAVFWSHGVPC